MSPVLTGPVSIRVAGRRVLRATPVRRGDALLLLEADGTEVSAAAPLAALLDRSDLIAALRPGGAPVEGFCGGPVTGFLRLSRVRGGAELTLELPDGTVRDAHEAPIRLLLPLLRAGPGGSGVAVLPKIEGGPDGSDPAVHARRGAGHGDGPDPRGA